MVDTKDANQPATAKMKDTEMELGMELTKELAKELDLTTSTAQEPPAPPDLQIRGSEVTLQPAGVVPPEDKKKTALASEEEEPLLHNMPSFRSEPFKYVFYFDEFYSIHEC